VHGYASLSLSPYPRARAREGCFVRSVKSVKSSGAVNPSRAASRLTASSFRRANPATKGEMDLSFCPA